jgi:hypothetical protein
LTKITYSFDTETIAGIYNPSNNKLPNLVPRAFLVVARELRKTLVKYDEISKILGDLSHAQ